MMPLHQPSSANGTSGTGQSFDVAIECPGVPSKILRPRAVWADPAPYDATARKLAVLFRENFKRYESGVSAAIKAAGPA